MSQAAVVFGLERDPQVEPQSGGALVMLAERAERNADEWWRERIAASLPQDVLDDIAEVRRLRRERGTP